MATKKKVSKKPVSKAKKSKPKYVTIPIHLSSKEIAFYEKLGSLCGITREKACLVVIMAESLRKTESNNAKFLKALGL